MLALRKSWLAAATLIGATAFGKQPSDQPLLLGGSLRIPTRPILTDPSLRRGAFILHAPRPIAERRWCTADEALCVHSTGDQQALAKRALDHLVIARRRLVSVLQLPSPSSDFGAGGSAGLDLYLPEESSSNAIRVELDAARWASDQSAAFCVSDATHVSLQAAARCIGGAIAATLDSAESPAVRTAFGAYLADRFFEPDDYSLAAVDDFQANPQANPFAPHASLPEAGGLYFAFLEDQLASSRDASLPSALLALSRSLTRGTHPEWNNEPDVLDVLRASIPHDQNLSQLAMDWALTRVFLGSRSDGAHHGDHSFVGDFGRLAMDWSVAYSSLPRHLASSRAIEPFGMSAVWLELDQVPPGAQLGVRLTWEEPVSFCWTAVAVDAQGREIARWDFPRLQRGTQLEKTLMNFEHAAGLLFVGVNLGGVDLDHPFDPDAYPWEPHAYTLYLADLR